eukprot:CAMPEP_0117441486 /NCGR_PEP_ID=MMETSP0759-20121206/3660_1 /TAXON_ID=63605 /ORGANISM="Percolomonas cosmopolitus, Strain WS" /LENGTH=728 /DNA_ID=CAMNT_0005233343 /DNA_START=772 /DNA_END=2955 /DNA_ORIENTATION=-
MVELGPRVLATCSMRKRSRITTMRAFSSYQKEDASLEEEDSLKQQFDNAFQRHDPSAAKTAIGQQTFLQTPLPQDTSPFRLTDNFLQQYKDKSPPFGFNGLGEIVYRRTYSRVDLETGKNEEWWQTVARVVNGTFNMQKRWIQEHRLGWNAWKAQKSAQEMYKRIFDMKFLPPGRGLWAMGSPITEHKKLFAALNNCAFISTDVMKSNSSEPSKPFYFLMDLSMLGVGVGFDTKGAGYHVKGPKPTPSEHTPLIIEDSREGWVESVRVLLDAHFLGKERPVFDYSQIRPKGAPIRGFGGISSGPETLQTLHRELEKILAPFDGKALTARAIVDVMNLIGKCIVSGNVRQTAEIAFGEYNDVEFMDLKNYDLNPERAAFGWTSNNSVFAKVGMKYGEVAKRIAHNGEPGIAFLHNMKAFSRMNSDEDWKDRRAAGGNPCLEQTLESYELCCLVETFPNNHEDLDDYLKTLKMAYLYAKTVTLGKTHWAESNRVMLRNRRIGCSMSGIAQFVTNRGIEELRRWCNTGYHAIQEHDRSFSDWLAIPRSIKTTSVKPSGTVSLLAGATPGLHYPESRHYIRRLRMGKSSSLLPPLIEAGYKVEVSVDDPENTMVVEFPVKLGDNIRTASELSMWEQLSLAAFMQKYWADNQVSCTVTFDPEKESTQIEHALDYFQYQLKGISFLPRLPMGAFKQMPYEHISAEEYEQMVSKIKTLDTSRASAAEPTPDKFCE